jgi:hypothetical protein
MDIFIGLSKADWNCSSYPNFQMQIWVLCYTLATGNKNPIDGWKICKADLVIFTANYAEPELPNSPFGKNTGWKSLMDTVILSFANIL